jgi:hypothetical protein
MKENVPMYLVTIALLAMAAYLRSPMIAVAVVGLWGIHVCETIFTRKNRDADITEILATIAAHKAQMSTLTKDITNVAERARTILGENY